MSGGKLGVLCPQCRVKVPSLSDKLAHRMDCTEPSRPGEVGSPKYPMIRVHLTGKDSNIYAIIGAVRHAMGRAGLHVSEKDAFSEEVTAARSYDEALQTVMKWVETA